MGWNDICMNQEDYKARLVYLKANLQMSNMHDSLVGDIVLFLFTTISYTYKLANHNSGGSRTLCSVCMPLNY